MCVCVCCGLRQCHAAAQRWFLSFCFNTASVNAHTNNISITQQVHSSWPTSKVKFCTLILSHLDTSIIYNTNSRQKYYAIMLAVGGRFTLGVYTLRYRQSSCPLISWSKVNSPRWTHIGASLVASSTPLHGSAGCGGCQHERRSYNFEHPVARSSSRDQLLLSESGNQ
jgi:hypothetical protein